MSALVKPDDLAEEVVIETELSQEERLIQAIDNWIATAERLVEALEADQQRHRGRRP